MCWFYEFTVISWHAGPAAIAEAAEAELVVAARAYHVRTTTFAIDRETALWAAARDGVDQLLARPAGSDARLVLGARHAVMRVTLTHNAHGIAAASAHHRGALVDQLERQRRRARRSRAVASVAHSFELRRRHTIKHFHARVCVEQNHVDARATVASMLAASAIHARHKDVASRLVN
jgi:hypothetical protein